MEFLQYNQRIVTGLICTAFYKILDESWVGLLFHIHAHVSLNKPVTSLSLHLYMSIVQGFSVPLV